MIEITESTTDREGEHSAYIHELNAYVTNHIPEVRTGNKEILGNDTQHVYKIMT